MQYCVICYTYLTVFNQPNQTTRIFQAVEICWAKPAPELHKGVPLSGLLSLLSVWGISCFGNITDRLRYAIHRLNLFELLGALKVCSSSTLSLFVEDGTSRHRNIIWEKRKLFEIEVTSLLKRWVWKVDVSILCYVTMMLILQYTAESWRWH